MGSCHSASADSKKATSTNKNQQLMAPPPRIIQKLLLLGPGESGKSTCVKQMQILHTNGFTDAEVEERKYIVYSNTVRSMMELCEAVNDLGLQFGDSSLMEEKAVLRKHIAEGLEFSYISSFVKNAIEKLWKDASIRIAYEKRSSYHVSDSAEYFFDNIERISDKEYKPTNQDILLTRVPTTGVVKILFTLKHIDFNVFDVGGQRSERRKWIHFFDDVNGIIFVAAISEYDQKIREDNQTNRLIEALELFDSIANSRYFTKSSMILFLNKKDLFEEKIKKVSLSIIFTSYTGGLDYNEAIAYIQRQFQKLYRSKRKLYIHETCATNTDQLNQVFESVLDAIVQENLKNTGML